MFSPFLCRSCSALQTFPNVLTHFVPSLCILVNIFMNVKLLYNQPSKLYAFKVIHLVVSLILTHWTKEMSETYWDLQFCVECIHSCILSVQPFVCVSVFLGLSWTSGPSVCVSLGPETWNLHSLINIQAFTGGCNSQVLLVLEPQRQTVLKGIAPLCLYLQSTLWKRNHWTRLGDTEMTLPTVVAIKTNSKKKPK